MNFIFKCLSVFFLSSVFFSCSRDFIPEDGLYKIEIYATNDLHGRFFDSLYVGDRAEVHPYSLASVSSYIKQRRSAVGDNNVVLLDIGDHLQGDNAVYYFNFVDNSSEHLFSRMANYIDYDAVVVGNHDIEAGHDVYDKISKELSMPYLAANALDKISGDPYFTPYTVLSKNGLRIAVIGLTNPNIPNWLSPYLWEGMEFIEIKESLQYWVDYVKNNESPHIIIAALHAGLGNVETYNIENPARFLAANIEGLDVVFASHDHKVTTEYINNGSKDVLLLEGGSRASYLSAAYVVLEIESGEVKRLSIDGESISMSDYSADSDFIEKFRDDYIAVRNFTNKKVGVLMNDISTRDSYFGSSAFIDMIHTLQLDITGAQVSFAAPLAFDVSKCSGELIYQDLTDIYPYENQLYVISMSGEEIKNYLEYSYSKWIYTYPSESGHLLQINDSTLGERSRFNNSFFNFDSAAGILYEVDITQNKGNRINILSMSDGSGFSMESVYKVALSSYRANGGGNLLVEGAGIPKDMLEDRKVSIFPDMRQLLYDKFEHEGYVSVDRLNNWRFVPDSLAQDLINKDYRVLFSK